MQKLKSRKFWISVAAFLASIAASISGMMTDHEVVTVIGVICGVLSAAIYAATEAMVDKASVSSEQTVRSETMAVSASTSSKEAFDSLMAVKEDQKIGGTDA